MGVGARTLTIAIFRNDLRLHDNPILSHSQLATVKEGERERKNKISSYVLPLYVFDERQIELSGLLGYRPSPGAAAARTPLCGFWRTGAHRLKLRLLMSSPSSISNPRKLNYQVDTDFLSTWTCVLLA